MGLTLSAFADEIDPDIQIQMDVLEQYGINQIDIRSIGGKPISEHSLHEAEEIKKKLEARHFRVTALGSVIGYIPISDDFEGQISLLKHTLDIAGILGTNRIRMFSFILPSGDDPALYRDEVLARWRHFVSVAEDRGALLMHQNEPCTYGDTVGRCLDLMKSLDSPWVSLVFDPANFVLSGQSVKPAWEKLREYVSELNIKDADWSDHHIEPAGMGDGDLADILADCVQSDFSGKLTIAPQLSHSPCMDKLDFGQDTAALPEGGSQKFDIAVTALINLLTELSFEPHKDPFKTGNPV